jgi:hypothetical protein
MNRPANDVMIEWKEKPIVAARTNGQRRAHSLRALMPESEDSACILIASSDPLWLRGAAYLLTAQSGT